MNSWQFRCITRLVNARPPTTKICLSVLFQLLDERDEVAVAADDHVGVDVAVGEGHLERVERQVDVGAVLVTAGGEVALHELRRVLREGSAVVAGARPVAVGDLGHHIPALLERLENHPDIELHAERALHPDLDIVEVDEYCNLQSCVCQTFLAFLPGRKSAECSLWIVLEVRRVLGSRGSKVLGSKGSRFQGSRFPEPGTWEP